MIDPIDGSGVEERLRGLGRPAGVIQLLDRHERDSDAFAARLGVPLHRVPRTVEPSPFRFLAVAASRWWREVALWWPDERVLVCADALGTLPYFLAGREAVGVHPLLRPRPPRALAGLGAAHVLVGHGEGLHGETTAAAVDDAVAHARRRIPRWIAQLPRLLRRG